MLIHQKVRSIHQHKNYKNKWRSKKQLKTKSKIMVSKTLRGYGAEFFKPFFLSVICFYCCFHYFEVVSLSFVIFHVKNPFLSYTFIACFNWQIYSWSLYLNGFLIECRGKQHFELKKTMKIEETFFNKMKTN